MQITDILAQVGGLQSMARELGISEAQAAAGAQALAPAILGGLQKQAQAQPGGLDGLGGLLGQLGGGGLLDSVLGAGPTNIGQGNDVLGQLFGSKDVSRAVAANAAAQTGLDTAVLKKMLPMLAMLVTGFLAQQSSASQVTSPGMGSGLGGLLGGLLGGGSAAAPDKSSGAGGLFSMLDMDGNGNPLDDILRMAGKLR